MKFSIKEKIGSIIVLAALTFVLSSVVPAMTKAQTVNTGSYSSGNTGSLTQINNANDLISRIASIGTVVVYLLVSLAIVFIVYSVVIYFIKGKEGEGRGAAGMQILWGIVGLAIILSLWGLVNILLQTFGTNTTAPTGQLPSANFMTNGTNQ